MNFDEVDLLSASHSSVITMGFRDPWLRKSYILRAIVGLDMDEIITKFNRRGVADDKFYHMSLGKREVVVRIALNPNYSSGETVDSLRTRIYQAITTNRTGAMTLQFKLNGTPFARLKGFMKKVEAATFSETPEVQITLDCSQDPVIRAIDETIVNLSSFALPQDAEIIDTQSTAPHGLVVTASCIEPVESFSLGYSSPQVWGFHIYPGLIDAVDGFIANDTVKVSSEDRNRYVVLIRDGELIHLAHKIMPQPIWPYIYPGTTMMRLGSGFVYTEIRHTPSYWGI